MLTGYHGYNDLPFRQGETVTVRKGTLIKYRGNLIEAKRTYNVKIHSTGPGSSMCVGFMTRGGDPRFMFSSENDRWQCKQLYGTDDLSQLWPRMRAFEGSIFLAISNPTITWPGRGGYWMDADMNQFVDGV